MCRARRLAREPQLFADQWQQRLRRKANRIQLRFDQAFACMHLAHFHKPLQAVDPLAVAPFKGHVIWEICIGCFVVGVSNDPCLWVYHLGVIGIGQASIPLIIPHPAKCRHAALGLVMMLRLGIAPITLNPMLSRSMNVTFCEGAIYPSNAAMASVTFSA